MELVKRIANQAAIQISIDESNVLINPIKETCKHIGDFGFHARIGSYPTQTMALVNLLFQKIDRLDDLEDNESIIKLSLDE